MAHVAGPKGILFCTVKHCYTTSYFIYHTHALFQYGTVGSSRLDTRGMLQYGTFVMMFTPTSEAPFAFCSFTLLIAVRVFVDHHSNLAVDRVECMVS